MSELVNRKCKPCEGGTEPLSIADARDLMPKIHADWSLDVETSSIRRHFEFRAFSRTMSFVNAVAFVAMNEGHHPQMIINYGSCTVSFRTTAIDGLSDNDFICAAKVDRLAEDT